MTQFSKHSWTFETVHSISTLLFSILARSKTLPSIADRGEAIRAAAMLARPGDIVLLAGKGHETYQIVGDERRHFDDRQQIEHQFSIHR